MLSATTVRWLFSLTASSDQMFDNSSPRRVVARGALLIIILFAAFRFFDTEARWAEAMVRGDRIEHALVVFLLLVFSAAALPKVVIWKPAVFLLALGVAVEAVQALPQVVGDAQLGDVVSDIIGVGLGSVVVWIVRTPASPAR